MENSVLKGEDVFRYISLHSFIRDVFNGYDSLKFSALSFSKAFENFAESEGDFLNKQKEKGLLSLLKMDSKDYIKKTLDNLEESSKVKNISKTKLNLFRFINELTQNSVKGETVMKSFVVLSASLGVSIDCSKVSYKDFENGSHESQKRINKEIINLTVKEFLDRSYKNELDLSNAILLVEDTIDKSLKSEKKDIKPSNLIKKKNSNKKF
jgi:hypothetical protein